MNFTILVDHVSMFLWLCMCVHLGTNCLEGNGCDVPIPASLCDFKVIKDFKGLGVLASTQDNVWLCDFRICHVISRVPLQL